VALDGRAAAGETRRRSAETLLHAEVYRLNEAGAVLHTHSVNATVSSRLFARAGGLMLQGYELLKAFPGIDGHDEHLRLPIFENSQDMALLSGQVGSWLREANESPRAHGFLLAGHGLYAWGKTLRDAKRHVEAFEALLECELKLLSASLLGIRQLE
jgi:methylthioribulose-1-phosphate dehydratase